MIFGIVLISTIIVIVMVVIIIVGGNLKKMRQYMWKLSTSQSDHDVGSFVRLPRLYLGLSESIHQETYSSIFDNQFSRCDLVE